MHNCKHLYNKLCIAHFIITVINFTFINAVLSKTNGWLYVLVNTGLNTVGRQWVKHSLWFLSDIHWQDCELLHFLKFHPRFVYSD